MSNIITGAIAVAMAVAFFIYYPFRLYFALGFAKSLPVWIISVGTLVLLVYDFVTSIMEEMKPPRK
jgi:hypothetical protein